MDIFLDFCLTCDRQTNGTMYCSQACRIAELDHSTYHTFSHSDHSDSQPESESQYTNGAATKSHSPFSLPPAYNFSLHLHRVSSQTSLSSVQTATSRTSALSEQAKNDLEQYAEAFDQVRTKKRRRTSL